MGSKQLQRSGNQSAAAAREKESHPSTWQVVTHLEINPNELAPTEKSNSH